MDDGNSLVTQADGQKVGEYPARDNSRPSFRSSVMLPPLRSAERTTSHGNAIPVPVNWQGRLSALSPSGRSHLFTRPANSATRWLTSDLVGEIIVLTACTGRPVVAAVNAS